MTTHTLAVPGAEIVYDVLGPLPPADGHPPLLMIAQPMTADGFHALASHVADRTVVLYDPRGLGRSTRSDGRADADPEGQAADLHALVAALDAGPRPALSAAPDPLRPTPLVPTSPRASSARDYVLRTLRPDTVRVVTTMTSGGDGTVRRRTWCGSAAA